MAKAFFGLSLFVKTQNPPQHPSVEEQNEYQACWGHLGNIHPLLSLSASPQCCSISDWEPEPHSPSNTQCSLDLFLSDLLFLLSWLTLWYPALDNLWFFTPTSGCSDISMAHLFIFLKFLFKCHVSGAYPNQIPLLSHGYSTSSSAFFFHSACHLPTRYIVWLFRLWSLERIGCII